MKIILTISVLTLTFRLFAQGNVNLASYRPNNYNGGYSITIFSEDYSNPGEGEISGNSALYDLPSGNTVYANETPLGGTKSGSGPGISGEYNGNSYTIGFYFATSENALQIAVNSGTPGYSTLMDTTFGAGQSGTYDPSDLALIYSIPNDPVGTPTYVGIAAWYSAGGAGSYAAAVAANVPRGDVFATNTFAPTVVPTVPPDLSGLGLTSFNLVVNVPEPSTVILGITSGSGLFLRRKLRDKKG